MTPERQLEIREQLARRMGWIYSEQFRIWYLESDINSGQLKPPDPFTDAADNRALVAWLAADDARWARFDDALLDCLIEDAEPIKAISRQNEWLTTHQQWGRLKLTAPLETITLAAARALKIIE